MTHAKFHFNWLMLTLIFGIWASEPPGPGERLKRPGLIGLRHGSVIEKAILDNQGSSVLRCFFSLLSINDNLVLCHLAKYVYLAFEKRKKSDMYPCLKKNC